MRTFYPLWTSSKFPVCNLPLNIDSYKSCEYDCVYCFSKNKHFIGEKSYYDSPNTDWLRYKFEKVYDEEYVNPRDFIEVLLKNRITLKGGVKADMFQSRELEDKHTSAVVEICNDFKQTILFNTKTDNLYDVPVTPKLHSFQLSVSNIYDRKDLEPNVAEIDKRVKFYDELKDEGFKVNIRIQPLIPNISDEKIFEKFKNPDHTCLCAIYLQPRNPEKMQRVLDAIDIDRKLFKQKGVLKMIPEVRQYYYNKFEEYLDSIGVSWSVSDTDMHDGTDFCCCGDKVVPNPTNFASMSMIKKYGRDYTFENLMEECGKYRKCHCYNMIHSNRQHGCKTAQDFYEDRWEQRVSPFSPKYNINPDELNPISVEEAELLLNTTKEKK